MTPFSHPYKFPLFYSNQDPTIPVPFQAQQLKYKIRTFSDFVKRAMQRRAASAVVSTLGRQLLRRPPCDVFVNHRGVDTKRNVAGLLYHHLRGLRLRPFLDSKSMKPGDRLFDKIDAAIRECKVGIAVFSPMYCDSYFCLHELSLMTQLRKRVVPVFCDVKPSDLRLKDDGSCSPEDLRKFRAALEEAKYTVGLTFDTVRGDWSEFLANATDVVIKNLIEVEEEEELTRKHKYIH